MGTWVIRTTVMTNPTGGFVLAAQPVPDGATTAANGTVTIPFLDDTDMLFLDGALTPTPLSGVPAGFTPDDAFKLHVSIAITGANGSVEFLVNPIAKHDVVVGPNMGTVPVDIDFTGMTFLAMVGIAGSDILATATFTGADALAIANLTNGDGTWDDVYNVSLTGTYTLVATTWYFNPVTNHYQQAASPPGAPWIVAAPPPVPDVDTVEAETEYDDGVAQGVLEPAFGCAGTAFVIEGSGFGDGATVKLGGVLATSVVVVDSELITGVAPAHADGAVNVVVTNTDGQISTLVNGFLYFTPWWVQTNTTVIDGVPYSVFFYVHQCNPPTDGLWIKTSVDPPFVSDPNGWYLSTAAYTGSVTVAPNGSPSDPRTWANIVAWATGDTGMLGGSPAASCGFKNRMLYPATGYTVGTHYPPIRVFNGAFDHELVRLPPTVAGGVPRAVMSMLTANGTIYLSTFDSGTTSADWLGRVFQLDLESGQLTPIGAPFAAGELPYALCWHMGRLWCGTNNGIGTVGKIYFFRPDIDTTWTLDHSAATDGAGGIDSLCSFQGNLFVGTDNAAGSRGKVLKRDTLGVYTVSLTGTGGTAHINNGYLALTAFAGALYASYWNNDGTAISKIQKFDGTTWTLAYTGALGTLRPFILLYADNGILFAVGGGMSLTGAIVTTPDGTTWTDRTANLPETGHTMLPMIGTEVF